jgi:mRNA interferase YafQ
MMLAIRPTSQFKKDLKKAKKQGRNLEALSRVLELLVREESLPPYSKDHKLTGNWKDFRECHIEPDYLLIYTVVGKEIRLTRLGTHSELFG